MIVIRQTVGIGKMAGQAAQFQSLLIHPVYKGGNRTCCSLRHSNSRIISGGEKHTVQEISNAKTLSNL